MWSFEPCTHEYDAVSKFVTRRITGLPQYFCSVMPNRPTNWTISNRNKRFLKAPAEDYQVRNFGQQLPKSQGVHFPKFAGQNRGRQHVAPIEEEVESTPPAQPFSGTWTLHSNVYGSAGSSFATNACQKKKKKGGIKIWDPDGVGAGAPAQVLHKSPWEIPSFCGPGSQPDRILRPSVACTPQQILLRWNVFRKKNSWEMLAWIEMEFCHNVCICERKQSSSLSCFVKLISPLTKLTRPKGLAVIWTFGLLLRVTHSGPFKNVKWHFPNWIQLIQLYLSNLFWPHQVSNNLIIPAKWKTFKICNRLGHW